ncbi:hypothetical protein PYW07_003817 [Mythimna separata]|uniref:Uncharacterized protein n=1 Tax=Mythimna separata TaxID=271217 RepID=A0AAD8DTF1_MYTSE|nr:hypothetical protein PYW07_003817 [Mythimna separata]
MSRVCVNSLDLFCYICGEFTPKSKKKPLSDLIKQCYQAYFNRVVRNQDKSWVLDLFMFLFLFMTFSLKIWDQSVTNMANAFTKMLLHLKSDFKADGSLLCSRITVGALLERPLLLSTREKPATPKKLRHFN